MLQELWTFYAKVLTYTYVHAKSEEVACWAYLAAYSAFADFIRCKASGPLLSQTQSNLKPPGCSCAVIDWNLFWRPLEAACMDTQLQMDQRAFGAQWTLKSCDFISCVIWYLWGIYHPISIIQHLYVLKNRTKNTVCYTILNRSQIATRFVLSLSLLLDTIQSIIFDL